MSMGMVGGLATTAVVGGVIGAGVTALATRNSDSGDGAIGTAKGLGIAAGITGGIGVAGLAVSMAGKQGLLDSILNAFLIGLPSVGLAGIGAGIGGAALGTALVGSMRD